MKLARVLQEMENIATFSLYSCIKRDDKGLIVLSEDGNPVIDWERLTPQQWAAITEYDAKKGRIKTSKAMMLVELRRRHEPPVTRAPVDGDDDDRAAPADEVARWDDAPSSGALAN